MDHGVGEALFDWDPQTIEKRLNWKYNHRWVIGTGKIDYGSPKTSMKLKME